MVLSFIIIMVIFFPKTSAGAAEVPVFVETPVISDLRLLTTMNGIPYFCLKIAIPESVVQLEAQRPGHGKVKLEFSGKVDAMDWGSSEAEAVILRSFNPARSRERKTPIICILSWKGSAK
jgi:hypothetical protein